MAIQDSDKVANGKYTSTKFDPNHGNNERGGAGAGLGCRAVGVWRADRRQR